MVINVYDHVGRCYSNEDGKILKDLIKSYLDIKEPVTVSFKNVSGVTSSFVNTALIELLDEYSFDFIKNNIKYVDTTHQINSMIKSRFMFEVKKRDKLILA